GVRSLGSALDVPSRRHAHGGEPRLAVESGVVPPHSKDGLFRGFYGDRLDVDELADAEVRQLAAVTTVLDAAEGQAWIGLHEHVDAAAAGLEFMRRNPRAALDVACEHCRAESEAGFVRRP